MICGRQSGPSRDNAVGFDPFLVDKCVSNVFMLASIPSKLSTDVAIRHPGVTEFLRPFREHFNDLLTSHREVVFIRVSIRHVEHPTCLMHDELSGPVHCIATDDRISVVFADRI